MTSVIFDPDAKMEFLAAIQFYDDCQHGLGRRFRFVVEFSIKKIAEAPFMYRILHAPFRRFLLPNFHMRSCIPLSQTIYGSLRLHILNANQDIG